MMKYITQILLALMVVLQGATLFYLYNPAPTPVFQGISREQEKINSKNLAILEEVNKLIEGGVNINSNPTIATITDIDLLKKDNTIQAEVYKDAKNGDLAIGFTNEMIIYRRDDNKIIYKGKNPVAIQQEQNYYAEIDLIKKKIGTRLTLSDKDVPQLIVANNIDDLKIQNPIIYKNIELGDRILVYPDQIIIYRLSNDTVVYTAPIKDGQIQSDALMNTQNLQEPANTTNQVTPQGE